MICKHCGAEIEENSDFCRMCGKPLVDGADRVDQESLENSEKNSKKSVPKMPVIVLSAIGCVVAIALISFYVLTGVSIVNETVEAGSVVTTKDLVKAKSGSATVTIEGEVDTSVLGDNKLRYTVKNGLLKATKEFHVQVVDTTAPVISGPSMVNLVLGKEFDPSDYYTVDDFEKDLEDKIEVTPSVDVNSETTQNVILSVKDSSGNEGTLAISVKKMKLTKNEEAALSAINQYIADGKSKDQILPSVWVMKTVGAVNGVDYYVEVANNVLYAVYFSGKVSEFTAIDCGGSTLHELMVYAVERNGAKVNSQKLK